MLSLSLQYATGSGRTTMYGVSFSGMAVGSSDRFCRSIANNETVGLGFNATRRCVCALA